MKLSSPLALAWTLLAGLLLTPTTTVLVNAQQNCPNGGKIFTQIKYDNNPEAVQVVLSEEGTKPEDADKFIIKSRNENAGLKGNTRNDVKCVNRGKLYSFILDDLGRNGLASPGYFAVEANNREVFRVSEFDDSQYAAFFAIDRETCVGNQKRARFELTFDASPSETTWRVVLLLNDTIISTLIDYTDTLPYLSETYNLPEMIENTLYVDKCIILGGTYAFILKDSANDGMESPGGFKVIVDDEVVASGTGAEFSSTLQKRFTITIQEGFNFICFSGSSTVNVLNKGIVPLNQLQIGDYVQTNGDDDSFEPVYAFGHYGPDQVGNFLKITTTTNRVLEISHDHMIYRKNQNDEDGVYVRASALKKGDLLVGLDNDDDLMMIRSISTTKAKGAFAPFTPSGTVMVNGILASSFTNVMTNENGNPNKLGLFSFQWIAHTFEFPHRVACHYLSKCDGDTDSMYNENGINTWVAAPHVIGRWFLDEPESNIFKMILTVTAVSMLMVFAALETILFYPNIGFIMAALVGGGGAAMMMMKNNKFRMTLETKKKVE